MSTANFHVIAPMLSAPQDDIPEGDGWLYEPKWDGFRTIVYRKDAQIHLSSRKQQPLERYFPELLIELADVLPNDIVVDGEIIIAGESGLDFDALLQRIHPAASRVTKLAEQTPSSFVAFDLIEIKGKDVKNLPLSQRRALLDEFIKSTPRVFLTPQTSSVKTARKWFSEYEGAGLDGIIAKRSDLLYRPGERVMVKIKHHRTADCVVGGYRINKAGQLASLLLGLYDDEGVLHHVGHTSSFNAKARKEILALLKPLEGGTSFGEGRTPGAPSRWSQKKDTSWVSLTPSLVCEVTFDHLQGNRFRHAATFARWRPDRDPKSCNYAQLRPVKPFDLTNFAASNLG